MDRRALHKISYGLYIVTSKRGDEINGQIANALMQTTSEPPMIAFCLNKQNLTHEYVRASGVVAVSVLSQETPMPFIGQFGFRSGRDAEKFEGANYRSGVTGAPIVLDHAVAFVEAEVKATMDAATHTLFLAVVLDGQVLDDEKQPMTYAYYHHVKGGKSPKTAPTYLPPEVEKGPSATKGVAAPALQKWVCKVCGYVYDPAVGDAEGGIPPGTPFEDVPDDWVCPVCGVGKEEFDPLTEAAVETEAVEKPAGQKWVCTVCGYVYEPAVGDPDGGVAPGTAFEDIPDDWLCPVCGASKDEFEPVVE